MDTLAQTQAEHRVPPALQVHDHDDVAVALRPLEGGEEAEVGRLTVTLRDPIIRIASGGETAAQRNGGREIAICKRGVTL